MLVQALNVYLDDRHCNNSHTRHDQDEDRIHEAVPDLFPGAYVIKLSASSIHGMDKMARVFVQFKIFEFWGTLSW